MPLDQENYTPEAVTITIDGQPLAVQKTETILEAALRHGFEIPNLCYNKKVSHTAACRLCIVKLKGRPMPVPSCTTYCEEGMEITAFDDELEEARRTVLDLALSNHNDDCISCTKDGSCELQDLAFRYNLGKQDRVFPPIWAEMEKTSDFSSPVLDYDASKCIQCGRCIKACYEIQGKGVLSFINRGIKTTVGTGYSRWADSTCDGCGECVQICPVGAITRKQVYGTMKRSRPKDVKKVTTTTCPYCGVGCQLDVATRQLNVTTDKGRKEILKVNGANIAPNFGKTCVKGRFGLDFVHRGDRLKKPLIKREGKHVEVEWDEALQYTARRLAEIKAQYGAEAIAGLSSARCTNEENYVFQKFIRSVVGTNNIDHCARLCHASTVAGLAVSFGSGAMTNSIDDIEESDVILVTGSNTTEAHPVIAAHIKRAVRFKNAKLIVVDPRKIELTRFASVWMRHNGGTDVAWINGMLQVIISEGLLNEDFIAARTENFEELKKAVAAYTPEYVETITGIPAGQLREAACIYGRAQRASIIYSMGITQHSNGTDNVKSLANLAMLTGNIGRPGTGVNPLRGQNNVQGACDVGALPNVYPGYQRVDDPAIQEKFEKIWKAKLSPAAGLTVVEMVHAAEQGKIKAMYIMGENPLVSDPNIGHVETAFGHLEFLVHQDIFLNETGMLADVVFPAASFAEKDGTFTNTERRVLAVTKFLDAPGEAREDWRIIQSIAQGMGSHWQYASWKDIMAEINVCVPQYGGIIPERITSGERLQWPCPAPGHPGTPILHREKFTRGKGLFCAVAYKGPKEKPCAEYPFTLLTGRILYHYHTGTMTRRTAVLPQFVRDGYVEIHPEDAKRLAVAQCEIVLVQSRRGSITTHANITDRVKPGTVFIPFHFAEAAANRLTNDVLDPTAKIPELKVCACIVKKVG